jgi:hypothetical protein
MLINLFQFRAFPRKNQMKLLLACSIAWLMSCPISFANDEITADEFRKLHAELVPGEETWKTIPWQTDLLAAQRLAVEKKKLIFIWAMDGHPLGCT